MIKISFNILNLEKRVDRKLMMSGNLNTMCVPFENIIFHKAIDGGTYESIEDICDAAIENGYTDFELYKESKNFGRGYLAYRWSVLKILETIQGGNYEFAYFNQDDRMLNIHFHTCLQMCEYLDSLPTEFLILQFQYQQLEDKRSKVVINNELGICEGLLGFGDSGIIVSRSGADFIYNTWQTLGYPTSFESLMSSKELNVPGTYAVENPDNFIKHIDTRFLGNEFDADQDRLILDRIDGTN